MTSCSGKELRHLCQSKLLAVGESGAGGTCLVLGVAWADASGAWQRVGRVNAVGTSKIHLSAVVSGSAET